LQELRRNKAKLTSDLEKWSRRKEDAPQRSAVVTQRQDEWLEAHEEENQRALQELRTLMSPRFNELSLREAAEQAKAAGGVYTHRLLQRLKTRKLLAWLRMSPTAICHVNFTGGPDVEEYNAFDRCVRERT
jgi:hypothetical protein